MRQVLLLGTEKQSTECVFEVCLGRRKEAGRTSLAKAQWRGMAGVLCLGTGEQHHSQVGSEAGKYKAEEEGQEL